MALSRNRTLPPARWCVYDSRPSLTMTTVISYRPRRTRRDEDRPRRRDLRGLVPATESVGNMGDDRQTTRPRRILLVAAALACLQLLAIPAVQARDADNAKHRRVHSFDGSCSVEG